MTASIVGSVGLSVEETNQIKVFIDEHRTEHLASLRLEPAGKYKTYLIRPHVQPESAMDGTVKFVRFSCVGFAIEAYRDAGIDVVVTDEALLPDVQLETLLNAYPGATVESWEWLNNRYKWGCNGDGPWRVVLPGYVFHALSKIARGSRSFQAYIPQAGDERFL
jgi:hypothetical protein